ncbi:uncharacterized protein [Misgurnus anguillicaudatus]|uniref:uncharacterized protein n=1 Tax=Misgurnus anguillicaudatus TaxID=75329 RepID=UPI003CCF2D0D
MDSTAATDIPAENRERPHTEHRPPAHLADYEVEYVPRQDHPPPAISCSKSKHCGKSRTTSKKSISSLGSKCSGRTSVSGGSAPILALSTVHAAILEEKVKEMELKEVQRQIQEDLCADIECQRLELQAKEAARQQEEALKAKEALTKQLERQRRLKKAENRLEVAKLVSSLLQEQNAEAPPDNFPTPDSFVAPPQSQADKATVISSSHQRHSTPQHAAVLYSAPTSTGITPVLPLAPLQATSLPFASSAAQPAMAPPILAQQPLAVSTMAQNIGATANLMLPAHQGAHHSRSGHATHYQSPTLAYAAFQPPQVATALTASYPAYMQAPGAEMLIASAYGIPKPTLPVFESGRESDFALLKMALDNLLNAHGHLSEQYKFQVLIGHLKLPSALQLAKAYMYDARPYTMALYALQEKYGQPRQLVQSELGAILNSPALKYGDANAFDTFALSVQSLVGMLRTLEGETGYELRCGSHVDRLLSKMPPAYRDGFVEYCLSHHILQTGTDITYTLPDLATWLQVKSQAKRISSRAASLYQSEVPKPVKKDPHTTHSKVQPASVFHTKEGQVDTTELVRAKYAAKPKPYCPYCDNKEHYLNSCEEFKKLTTSQIVKWIKEGRRCWRCGRGHAVDSCTLKRPCKVCKETHLTILHESVQEVQHSVLMVSLPPTRIYLDHPNRSQKVMLKVIKVLLHNGDLTMESYAVLDDGSERSIVLPQVVNQLKLLKHPETLPLRTVHQRSLSLMVHQLLFKCPPVMHLWRGIRSHMPSLLIACASLTLPTQWLPYKGNTST